MTADEQQPPRPRRDAVQEMILAIVAVHAERRAAELMAEALNEPIDTTTGWVAEAVAANPLRVGELRAEAQHKWFWMTL